MPLPSPNTGEASDDWMSRCMGDKVMQKEFPDKDQRAAVCHQKEREASDGKALDDLADAVNDAATALNSREDREIGTKAATAALEFTDDVKGEVRAVVYKLGAVDRDREVILPPGFQGEAKVKLSHYGHSGILPQAKGTGHPVEPPVGKGVVRVNADNEVEFQGKYFMSTERGKEAYFTAKEMGPEQEWSLTFWRDKGEPADKEWAAKGARRVWRSGIEPFEVSPVSVASSYGTRTVGLKAAEEEAALAQKAADDAAAVAEVARLAAESEAQVAKDASAEAERLKAEEADMATKQAEARVKALTDEAMEEYHRVQRALRRSGLIA